MESCAIQALPRELMAASFLACWTRKEAVVKAIGTGFAQGLDTFDVSTEPGISQCHAKLRLEDGSIDTWWVDTVPCGGGFVGALAYRLGPTNIRYWS